MDLDFQALCEQTSDTLWIQASAEGAGLFDYRLIWALQWDHIYTAGYFVLLLALLAASLAACTTTRQWPMVRVARRYIAPSFLSFLFKSLIQLCLLRPVMSLEIVLTCKLSLYSKIPTSWGQYDSLLMSTVLPAQPTCTSHSQLLCIHMWRAFADWFLLNKVEVGGLRGSDSRPRQPRKHTHASWRQNPRFWRALEGQRLFCLYKARQHVCVQGHGRQVRSNWRPC